MKEAQHVALPVFVEALRRLVFKGGRGLLITGSDDISPELPALVSTTMLEIEVSSVPETEESVVALRGLEVASRAVVLVPSLLSTRDLSDEFRRAHNSRILGQVQLEALLESAPAGTLVAGLIPTTHLTSSASADWRRELFGTHSLVAIVFCGPAHPYSGLHPQFSLALVVLQAGVKHSQSNQETLFLQLSEMVDADLFSEIEVRLEESSQRDILQGDNAYFASVNPVAGIPLTFERFHPAHRSRRRNVASIGEMRPLSDVVEIIHLLPLPREGRAIREEDREKRIVKGRNIRSGLIEFLPEDLGNQGLRADSLVALQDRDICLRRIIGRGPLHLARVRVDLLPAFANDTVLVLRPRPGISEEDLNVLVTYLESDVFREVLTAEGVAYMLNASTMARMEVPKATRDVAIAISELNDAVARLGQWAEEAREARKQLFGYHSGKAARLHILQAGRGVRQRVASARLVENFAHRVRSRYPLPIAYRWRTVEAATPDLEGYLQILECAEATLAYTALVGVYLSRYLGREPFGKVRELGARFAQRKGHGINFGDWRSILDETSSRKFRKLAAAAPFYEVTALLDSGETEAAIRALIDSRNDQSHGRGPKDGAIEAAFAERKTQLETLLKGVEFLSEYPLRYIESARWDSIRNENTVRYRDLMGDHPLTPVFQETVVSGPLEQGSVYLVDRAGLYHLMRPLLIRRRCPECGTMATFTLEGYDQADSTCRLKSLEHSHIASVQDSGLTDAFKLVGLIAPSQLEQ